MASLDLVAVDTLKEYLAGTNAAGVSDKDDALLSRLVTAASRYLLSQMNRSTLAVATYTESFVGQGTKKFVPRQDPIVAVTSVLVNDNAVPAYANGVGWKLLTDNGQNQFIQLFGYEFCVGQLCEISYTAGYASIPEDIEQACCELAALRYRSRKRLGLVSEAMAGGAGTVSYSMKDVSAETREVIDQYTLRY